MTIDAGIVGRANQPPDTTVLTLGRRSITTFRGEAKIDGVNPITILSCTHRKVFRLDVPMEEAFGVSFWSELAPDG